MIRRISKFLSVSIVLLSSFISSVDSNAEVGNPVMVTGWTHAFPIGVKVSNLSEITNGNTLSDIKNVIDSIVQLLKDQYDSLWGKDGDGKSGKILDLKNELMYPEEKKYKLEDMQKSSDARLGSRISSADSSKASVDNTIVRDVLASDDKGRFMESWRLSSKPSIDDSSGKDVENIFNPWYLVEPIVYDMNTKNESLARIVVDYIRNIGAIPQMIKVSKRFEVPFSTDPKRQTTVIDLSTLNIPGTGKSNNVDRNIGYVNSILNMDTNYVSMKTNYRSQMMIRSFYIANMLKVLQDRIPISDEKYNKKSAVQLEYENATRRLTSDYKKYIRELPPSAVEREMLFLLSEMRYEMYEMRRDNEKLLIALSINGLGSNLSVLSQMTDRPKFQEIGKKIYCIQNPKDKVCSSDLPASMPNFGL